ncbi:hypothetical protein ACFQZ4_27590 [Catellatospora coxensis]|uniref:DUF7660 domain-containing protein n=1 Tax=Catellatospora coxensis TaxID=310354 RepID=A0A8J3PA66_9ACTN|nr:hypothetical protein [Catellatospora coxensis]GIG09078.1 hypothetical protein Cco03nite_57780 [Catellatospora coxensis]
MSAHETGRFAAVPQDDVQAVTSATEVAEVVERMLHDLRAHPTAWENGTLERFLDSLARCLKAQPQLYANLGRQYPAAAEWRLFAEALIAASGYE